MPGTDISTCLKRVAQTYRRFSSRPVVDRCRSYGNQALTLHNLTIFFPLLTKDILILWRFRSHTRSRFLNSLMSLSQLLLMTLSHCFYHSVKPFVFICVIDRSVALALGTINSHYLSVLPERQHCCLNITRESSELA